MPDRSYAEGINTQRIALAANLTTMGVSSVGTESLTDLVGKVLDIVTGGSVLTGDAVVGEVLAGKTFYSNDPDTKLTGTMPDKEGDNACSSSSVDGTTLKLVAPTGFYDGTDTVTITDADFTAANIKKDVDLFGITGTLEATAEAPIEYTHVTRTNAQDVGANTYTAVTWENEVNDDLTAWAAGAPTRLTVPAGITKVELETYIAYAGSSDIGTRSVKIVKSGSTVIVERAGIAAYGSTDTYLRSGIISVGAGDYFEVYALASNGDDIANVTATCFMYFGMVKVA